MGRIAYVNGQYVRHEDAEVHIEDRGYQFADAIYEVVGVLDGRVRDEAPHLDRLERSLGELRIPMPTSRAALEIIIRQMIRRNHMTNGMIYIQVSRGVAHRDHAFPKQLIRPTLVMTGHSFSAAAAHKRAEEGVGVMTQPDIRWGRCDIKTTALTANILAKQAAREGGAYEAWLVDEEGYVTEGSTTSAWIIDKNGKLITRYLDNGILPGVTRKVLMEVAAREGIEVEERKFTVEEAKEAREAFITAATLFVTPVVSIDGTPIGNGHPGQLALKLREDYLSLQA